MTCWKCALVLALLSSACATEQSVGAGNPRTLAPLLGDVRAAEVARAEPASEPVEDYAVDLGLLKEAWPAVEGQLPHLIRSLIARGSWKDIHHSVSGHGVVLRVRHRPAVIAEVKKLVQALELQLLRPLLLQVAFVETDVSAHKAIFPRDKATGAPGFEPRAFAAAVKSKRARDLTRVAFSAYNGQWKSSARLKKHALLSGVTLSGATLVPRTTPLVSGATVQGAAWRWGEARAVVALSASFTGTARGGTAVRQKVHRALPQLKKGEHRWEAHELELSLPVRELVEYSGKLTIPRGRWTVAALAPRGAERLCAVLVKVDWEPPRAQLPVISPKGADGSFALQMIPVALPSETRRTPRIAASPDFRNRQTIEDQAQSFERRAMKRQQIQKKNTYNFQSVAGSLVLSATRKEAAKGAYRTYYRKTEGYKSSGYSKLQQARALRPRAQNVFGAMPPHLDALKAEVMKAKWPTGTALEFAANHVFAVHRPEVLKKVAELLEGTHAWRNRPVVTRVGFARLTTGEAQALESARVDDVTAKRLMAHPARGAATLLGRGGTRNELFVAEMHTVLASAWAANSSSPGMQVYFEGLRLSIMPQLGHEVGRALALFVKRFELEDTTPKRVGGAVLQQPRDGSWTHQRTLHLPKAGSLLTGLRHDVDGATEGLLLTSWTLGE